MENLVDLVTLAMAEVEAALDVKGISDMWEVTHYESGRIFVNVYGPRGTGGAININIFSDWLERQPERSVEDGSSGATATNER